MRCDYVPCSSTEVGYAVERPPRPQGLDWQWLAPRKTVDFRFEPFHKDLYGMVIKVRREVVCRIHQLATLYSRVPPITHPFRER